LTALSDFSSSGPEEALQKFRRLSREKLEGDPMMPPALMHQTQAELTKVQILENLGRLYRLVLPYLSILALLGYIYLGIILIQRKGDALIWVILTSVLLAVLARIVLLAIIDVTSFYAVTLYYLSPAFLLFQAFIVVSWFGCLQSLIKDWHPHWSRSAPEKR
jgi:phosphoglycerol transferase MdoB-like AlkP superfamily enzyme